MCELFGFTATKEYKINAYLEEFYSHCDRHPHGWGFADLSFDEAIIEKEPVKASESAYLKERLTVPIVVKKAFAHIRLATVGQLAYVNSHPFTMADARDRKWTLNHNGTIFSYEPLEKYRDKQSGGTDSERMLMHIVELMNDAYAKKGEDLTREERFRILDDLIVKITDGNKINMILYDGEVMYAHTNFRDTLHYMKKKDATVISTMPLSDEGWMDMPFDCLVAFKEEETLFMGTDHGHEFFNDPKRYENLPKIM